MTQEKKFASCYAEQKAVIREVRESASWGCIRRTMNFKGQDTLPDDLRRKLDRDGEIHLAL